ncbi:DinB family protein [Dinghuibacter silviterrae]|uniref:DinB family protein n=1 Tax=Dinghuibacter silviterrae TaxID=1539049 RepID=A0A4R8DYT2_9BACT|nr:DinB family protein [Dinghuibacter silviterrae]TDX02371.1 DinB family protein [Dinghuibacter silviterrae]
MAMEKHNEELIKTLARNLRTSHAHITLDRALRGLPEDLRGKVPPGFPYSVWQLVEHIRIAQWDMVMFAIDPSHESPDWPEGYWPSESIPVSGEVWKESLRKIDADREAFIHFLERPGTDLFTPLAHGEGQTLLQEALQIIDHNSYHVAEIVTVRRALGAWAK